MARKKITRRIAPLPKSPVLREAENKAELLLELLRKVAVAGQKPQAQLFHSLRDVSKRYHVSLSLGARVYRELEREGFLRCVRGSRTLLEGLDGARQLVRRGPVAIAVSLSQFFTSIDCRIFVIALERELWKRGYGAAKIFFQPNETADDFAIRVKDSRSDRVVWYCPRKGAGQVALRLHDAGIRVIGVSDKGPPSIPCQYEISREMALREIVAAWKRGGIMLVKVAAGQVPSAAREVRIAAALDEFNIDLKFTRLDGQAPQRFVNALARGSNFGVVILNSAVSLLAMRAPDALARLLNSSRLAFVDGPANLTFTKLTDATVADLVAVDWHRVAKRIVDDLPCASRAIDRPSTFQATAALSVPLSQYSQRW